MPSEEFCAEQSYIRKDNRDLNWEQSINELYSYNECTVVKEGRIFNKRLYDLIANNWPDPIKHFNFIGVAHGTFSGINIKYNTNSDCYKSKSIELLDGDSTVPLISALAKESWLGSTNLYTDASHGGIVLKKIVLEAIQNIIKDENIPISDKLLTHYTPKENWDYLLVDCPVDVYYSNEEEEINLSSQSVTKIYLEDAKYLILNNLNDSKAMEETQFIEIEPYDHGYTKVEAVNIKDGKFNSITKFKTIAANPNATSYLELNVNEENNKLQLFETEVSEKNNEVTVHPVEYKKINKNDKEEKLIINTEVSFESTGKNQNNHFDEKGLSINFDTNKNPYILDTYYRLNNGKWNVYSKKLQINLNNNEDINPGKNKIEYYSTDIFDNSEEIKSKVFYLHPEKPEIIVKVTIPHNEKVKIEVNSKFEGIKNYEFKYLIDGKEKDEISEFSVDDTIRFKVFTTDIFNRSIESDEKKINFSKLVNLLWNTNGFEGTFKDIIETLDNNILLERPQDVVVATNSKQNIKNINDSITKRMKKIQIQINQWEYDIELMPKLELYMHYHSEVIERKEKELQIGFSIYDEFGKQLSDLTPHIICSYLPVKDENHDIKLFNLNSNEKGIYTLHLDTSYLTKQAEKIKIDIKESAKKTNSLSTKIFKLV